MSTRLRYPKGYQFFDANGHPLALGSLYYYIAGTSTPQDTYSDSAGTVPNTNPVVLDGSGRLQVDVYLGSAADYKEVLTTYSTTVSPWPDDNIVRATSIAVFTGDSGSGGASGLVPAPAAGDALANKFLKADGTWATTPAGSGSSATNLLASETATTVTIASSTGSGATIPAATSTSAGVLDSARAAKIDGLAAVAASGSYTDLSNTPAIPAAQVNSDWNATSGLAQILNKPSTIAPISHAATHAATGSDAISISASQVSGLAAVATSGTYSSLSSTPAIPTAGTTLPLMDGVASAGSSTSFSCADHVHPTDTSRAPLASPAFTGAPTAPTQTAGNNSTSLATTAYLDQQLGTANGIATLDSSGKLTAAQIPASLVGAVVYQGTWNASTNAPAITGGVGTKGNYYKVSVAGTTSIDGISQWNVGDTIIFDGTAWDKIDGIANEVVSVAGLNGAITATSLKSALAIAAGDVSGLATVATSGAYSSLSGVPGAFTGDSGSGGSTGLVPAPASGTAAAGKFLKADGTWAVPASGGSGMSNPMTTAGDIIIGGASGAASRLGIGSTNQVLTVKSGAPAWSNAPITITTNTTYNIKHDGTGDFTDLNAALRYLSQAVIPQNVYVTLQLDNGDHSYTAPITVFSGFRQVIIAGNYYTTTLSSVASSSGSAGAWSYVLNVASAANVVAGDYVTIYGVSGGTNPTYLAGCFKVTAVSGNQVTISSTHLMTSAASGSVTGNVIIHKAHIKSTGCTGVQVWNGGSVINITGPVFVGDGTAGYIGLDIEDFGRVLGSYVGIVGYATNLLAIYDSEYVNNSVLGLGGGATGVQLTSGSVLDGGVLVVNGASSIGVTVYSGASYNSQASHIITGCVEGLVATYGGIVYGSATLSGHTTRGCRFRWGGQGDQSGFTYTTNWGNAVNYNQISAYSLSVYGTGSSITPGVSAPTFQIAAGNAGAFGSNVTTVANLPTASSSAGLRAIVSDSTVAASGNYAAVVAGGGSNIAPVWCNGTNWLVG